MVNQENIKRLFEIPRMYYLPLQANNTVRGLYDMMKEISRPYFIMAEIGSFSGVSSMLFAEMCKRVYCIDLWKEYPELNAEKLSTAEMMFDENAKQYPNIYKLKGYSLDCVNYFSDGVLDMVYIDGAHDIPSARADLKAWLPKIRKGGWITGHDIDLDVRVAVEEVIGKDYKKYSDTSWAKQIK